jgi:hypothetical protein
MMKDDRALALRRAIAEIRVKLDRWVILYETDQFTETVGDLAGYILQGDPQTIDAQLQGITECISIYPSPCGQIIINWR